MPAPSQIACQLYTLRSFTKTPLDIAKTFAKVKKIGYDAVQVSGMGPIDPKELKKILDGEGLTCCATHCAFDKIKSEPQRYIDDHLLWNCKYTAIGGYWLPKDTPWSAAAWQSFIAEYNPLAKKLAAAGLRLGYHNHSHELARFGNKTGLDLLVDGLSKDVWMELDTYWIVHGGADPVAWIHRVANRIPCVHLKDMAVALNPKPEPVMAEVGEGNLNWKAILEACRAAGTEWYIVEQDECQRDPFESIEISLRNLKAMGVD